MSKPRITRAGTGKEVPTSDKPAALTAAVGAPEARPDFKPPNHFRPYIPPPETPEAPLPDALEAKAVEQLKAFTAEARMNRVVDKLEAADIDATVDAARFVNRKRQEATGDPAGQKAISDALAVAEAVLADPTAALQGAAVSQPYRLGRAALAEINPTPIPNAASLANDAKRKMFAIGRIASPEIMARMVKIALTSRDERAALTAGDRVLDRIYGRPKETIDDTQDKEQEKKRLDIRKLMKACSDEELAVLKGVFQKIASAQQDDVENNTSYEIPPDEPPSEAEVYGPGETTPADIKEQVDAVEDEATP